MRLRQNNTRNSERAHIHKVHTYMHMHTCMRMCAHAEMCVYVNVCTHVCMHVCKNICLNVCVYVYIELYRYGYHLFHNELKWLTRTSGGSTLPCTLRVERSATASHREATAHVSKPHQTMPQRCCIASCRLEYTILITYPGRAFHPRTAVSPLADLQQISVQANP